MRAILIATAMMMLGFFGVPAAAQASQPDAISALAQSAQPRRVPPRVTVTPRQPAASLYPSPYPYAFPGPGHHRECTSWLEQEARPSGTVIVPRMRCWWVRSY
jgi:hypothetical protein